MTGEGDQGEIERIEALPLDERAEAYLDVQRRLQERLERPASA